MVDEFNLLDVHKFVEPCESTRAQINEHGSARMLPMGNLESPGKGKCVWCAAELSGARRRWCSEACVMSAMDYCYPQTPGAKMRRLIFDQACACKGCGVSFEADLRARILRKFNNINHYKKPHEKPDLVSMHSLGYNTGDIWQTDHITPVSRGGKGIDPSNLQVLCVECHDSKTIRENKER